MAAITVVTIDNDGADPGLRPAAAGDTIAPSGGGVILLVRNGSGASITATVATYGTIYGQPIPDVPLVVPAGATRAVAVEPAWADATTGVVGVSYSATALVEVAAIKRYA